MSGNEAKSFEFDAGHQERLSKNTLDRIRRLANEIIERHGEEKNAGLGKRADEYHATFIKAYQKWGITAETPVIKQVVAELDNARALPAYLKSGQRPQAVVILKPLIPQIPYEYKICYGERSSLHERWFSEGIQIDIFDDNPLKTGVFERDPSTRDYLIRTMTEGRGRDVILDLEEVLAGYYDGQHERDS